MHFLFIINPLFAWISSLYEIKNSFIYTWLFVIFFGFTFGIEASNDADISRYMNQVSDLSKEKISLTYLYNYYLNLGEIDFFNIMLMGLVASITDNAYFIVVLYSIIFGFFYAKNLSYFLHLLKGKSSFNIRFLLMATMLVMPFWKLGGFRFNTSVHIFIFGILPYIFENSKRRLLWIYTIPFLFHFSFILPVSLFVFYRFIGNRIFLYFSFFILSFIYSELESTTLNFLFDRYSNDIVSERTIMYRSEDKIEEHRKADYLNQLNWHARIYQKTIKWCLAIYLVYIFTQYRKLLYMDKSIVTALCMALLFFGVANIMNSLPSGGRFYAISHLIGLSLVLKYLHSLTNGHIFNRIVTLSRPLILVFLVVTVRESFYHFSLVTLFGNPIFAFFTFGNNVTIEELIKG